MKKHACNVSQYTFLCVLCCFLLLGGYVAVNPTTVETFDASGLAGVWVGKSETGDNIEISLTGDEYNIKVNGVDNNRGTFSIQKTTNNIFIAFIIHERFDAKINWIWKAIRYHTEAGNLILESSEYKGTYTRKP